MILAPLGGAVIGLIAGSFIATILIRWPQGRSALRGRSQCDGCGETLRAHELVPVLSHLASRGRCRRCGAAIDQRHLAIEVAAAVIGFLAFFGHPGPAGAVTALFGWWLLLLAAIDLEHYWLPDRLTLPLIPAGLLAAWLGYGLPLEDSLIGAAAGFAALWAIAAAYRRVRGRDGMGGGDPKLLAGIGAWVGWQQLPLIVLGASLLGLAAVLLIRLRGRVVSGVDRLPLGTLLAIAAWPVWLLLLTQV